MMLAEEFLGPEKQKESADSFLDSRGSVDDFLGPDPVGAKPAEKEQPGFIEKNVTQPSKNIVFGAAGALNRGMATFSDNLDRLTTYVSEKTGLPKGGLFEGATKTYTENAEYWDNKVKDQGLSEEIAAEFLGGAAPGMAEFMLNVPYAAALGYTEDGLKGAAKEGAHRFVMGKILHAANTLKTPSRTGAMATVGGVDAAAQGGDARDIAKSAGVMAGFGMVGGKGKKGIKDVVRDVRPKKSPVLEKPMPKEALKAEEFLDAKEGEVLESTALEPIKETAIETVSGKPPLQGVKRSSVIDFMSKKLEVPIRHGKYAGFRRNVLGVHKGHEKVIRLKRPNDLPTAVHETAHHFEELLGLNPKMPQEVRKMAYPGARSKNREGFAEFVKFYVTQPAKAKAEAPQFYEAFETALAKNPDVNEVMTKTRQAWNIWESSSSVSKIHSMIKRGGEKAKLPTFNEVYTKLKDDFHPLRLAEQAAEKKGHVLTNAEKPYLAARLTRGWTRKAEQYLKWGTFQYDAQKGVNFTGKSLREIIEPVEKAGEMELLDIYMIAKRASNDPRIQQGFEGILSGKDFKQAVKELEPRFKDTAEALYKYSDQLLSFLVDSGRVGKQTANAIRSKNLFYAPFYRVMDNEPSLNGLSSKKFGSVFNPIKKLKGSSRDIYSPTESLLYNTYAMINAAERNRVGQAFMKLAKKEGMGELIEKVPFPLKSIKMNTSEALESIFRGMPKMQREQLFNLLDTLPPEMVNEMAMTFRPNYKAGPSEAIFYQGGKPVLFELSPDIAKAINNINAADVNMLVKIFAFPAKLLRAGATSFSPEFAIRNPLRDQMTAFIQSKYGFVPGVDFTRGIFHMMKKDKLWQEFNASGAAHSSIVSMDRKYVSKNLKKMMSEGKVSGYIKNPLELIQRISEYTEEASRVGEFSKARKKLGQSQNALMEAGLAGREVSLDFSRQGGAGARAANLMSAFWNARIEGLDKMARTFKDQPMKATAKAFLGVTLPSVLLWYSQKDDPYYQEIPPWRKTLFWNFVIHNKDGSLKTILSIPKPFEYGLIFGSIPESALDWAYTKDPEAFKETMSSVGKTFDLFPIPTALYPIAEWWGNKSVYFDRPIVPRGKEDLEPVLQSGGHTSETVKLVAEMMDKVPGLKEVASPAKIENLIKGYTAGFGRLALEQADWALETLGVVDTPPDPAWTMADVPGARAFFSRFPSSNTRSIETFYKKYEALNETWESAKQRSGVRGTGKKTKAPETLDKYRKTAKALSMLRRMANSVHGSKKISPENKRECLDNIYIAMSNVAAAALGKKGISINDMPKKLSEVKP